jgi:ABC-type nickel/cobalt efflux system permease component RcnA
MKSLPAPLPFICLALFPAALLSHPMGNFSVSHYTKIEVSRGGAHVRFALDLAEIPTFELLREWKLEAASPRPALESRARKQAAAWMGNLTFRSNGRQVFPGIEKTELAVAEGAGGLPVLRITADLTLPVSAGRIEFEDRNYPDRAGWKEIVIEAGSGARLEKASHTGRDRSQALTAYPEDLTTAPPQDLRAAIEWTVEAPTAARAAPKPVIAPAPPASETVPAPSRPPEAKAAGTVVRGDYLSQLLGNRDLTWPMILAGIAVAFGLGAIHALSPGHGKTIVAAYLVGTRGTAKHAVFLGGMVTFTHTISVFALGLTTLFLSQYVVPEKIYPVLGAISGLSIVWIGGTLFYKRAMRLRSPHSHDGHTHSHGAYTHTHDGHTHSHVPEGDVTMGSLIALGASGGLVPCPSALVLLLSSVALGRVGLGLMLLVGFSAGLAVVLMAIGLIVLYAKNLLPDREKTASSRAFRLIPVFSAALITCVGLLMTGVSLGWIRPAGYVG